MPLKWQTGIGSAWHPTYLEARVDRGCNQQHVRGVCARLHLGLRGIEELDTIMHRLCQGMLTVDELRTLTTAQLSTFPKRPLTKRTCTLQKRAEQPV